MRRVTSVLVLLVMVSFPFFPDISSIRLTADASLAATDHLPIVITCDSNFTEQGWPGYGTVTNPFIIENLHIFTNSSCISISNTSAFFTIRNCELESYWFESVGLGYNAIEIENVENGLIEDCIIDAKAACVFLFKCENANVTNNNIESSQSQSVYAVDVSNCEFSSNVMLNSGIEMIEGMSTSIVNNLITDSQSAGMHLSNASNLRIVSNSILSSVSHGIHLDEISQTEVLRNNIANSGAYGITAFVMNCRFIGNSLSDNSGYGIDLEGFGNVLFENYFLRNGLSNARDRGTNNTWDDSDHLGNYWDDYFGLGIYAIDGSSGIEDRFPQIYPGIIPPLYSLLAVLIVGVTLLGLIFIKRRRA
jgi:parallel beta-helix repeat protein